MPQAPTYEQLATLIALDLYAAFEPGPDGRLEIEHFAENDFDVPCDILRRLGILEAARPNGHLHALKVDWKPGQPLPLARHAGEPSYEDLVPALIRIYRWYPTELWGRDVFETSTRDVPEVSSEAYHKFVRASVADAIARLGLGEWIDDELFVLTPASDSIPEAATYWQHRPSARS